MENKKFLLASSIILSLRDFILDNRISDSDSITLSQKHFDDIVLDYRKTYNEGIEIPYKLLGVLIKEDKNNLIESGTVIVKYDDPESFSNDVKEQEFYGDEIAYRCGWCGNVVDYDGSELGQEERSKMIRYIEQTLVRPIQKDVHGHCCRDRQRG